MQKLAWDNEDKKIYNLQYATLPVQLIPDEKLETVVEILLVKINVITGWTNPKSQEILNVLVDQFSKKLKEEYGSLNVDEIEYAFRNYGSEIEDWGKSINLNLISKVLRPYLTRRAFMRELEAREVAKKNTAPQIACKADWKEQCEHYYQLFRKGTANLDMWPHQMYDEFIECGMMEKGVHEDFLPDAKSKIEGRLKAEKEIAEMTKNHKQVESIVKLLGEPVTDDQVLRYAKKLAVLKLYTEADKQNIQNLFIQEK